MENTKINRGGGKSQEVYSPSEDKKYTNDDLKIMQGWSLERKIQVTQTRIIEWYKHYDGKIYVSFSGGKDSTVLAYLVARVCKTLNYKLILWFSDTGLEFPEVREHVKSYDQWLKKTFDMEVETIIDYPTDRTGKRISFKDIIINEGYPIISKSVSRQIKDVHKLGKNCWAYRCFDGSEIGLYNMQKWKFLLEAPFKISNKCCDIMKKRPAHKFNRSSGLVPIIGTMACESRLRKTVWMRSGCNMFNEKDPKSQPISFWTEQDVLECLIRFRIPYASVYGDIQQDENGKWYTSGYDRTGCVFCAFGCHFDKEPNRFQRLHKTHPKLWNYCMKPVEEGGLGMKEVLEYIGVKIK